MQYSHSRVETFNNCKRQFKYRYIDNLETIQDYDPQNPLIVGTALHHGIETNIDEAINEYLMSYPIINTAHSYEQIKLEYWIPKVKELIAKFGELEFEHEINNDVFKGFIDLLVKNPDGTYDIYDFKYSNNIDHYLESPQLSLYKYFYEKQTGNKVNKLGFIFVPKIAIRQKKTETENQFINRLKETLDSKEIQIKYVEYNQQKVNKFFTDITSIEHETEFPKNETRLCDWCVYKNWCQESNDIDILGGLKMLLPKNERTQTKTTEKRKLFFYARPFTGKSYLANSFPDVLFLSTDGNYTQLPGGIPPHIDIKDEVTLNGRIKETKMAWELFKEAIDELELKQNDFKTIVVDLLEDTYEHCRLFMFKKLGIEHESDDSFRAYDKVRVEFLSVIKRLMNLDYENIILLSHEDTSKDIMKKSGDKITAIKPNLNDKIALKIAGMCDIVARIVCEDNNRTISFKQSEVVFGGGRLNIKETEIPCTYEALMKVYQEASNNVGVKEKKVNAPSNVEPTKVESAKVEETTNNVEATKEEVPVRRVRRVRE